MADPGANPRSPRNRSITKQLETVTAPTPRPDMALEDLPKLRRGKYRFVLEEWCWKRVPRRSWVFQHGFCLVLVHGSSTHAVGTHFWLCHACDKKGSLADGLFKCEHATSSASSHLRNAHSIDKIAEKDPEEPKPPLPIAIPKPASAAVTAKSAPSKPLVAGTVKAFQECLLEWIVSAAIPFSVISHPHFRTLLLTPPEVIQQALPSSSATIKNWLLLQYKEKKQLVKEQLRTASSVINFTFDLWSSPNGYTILGVLGHFIDSKKLSTTRILGCRRLEGSPSGENMALLLREICTDFALSWNKIGCFTLDTNESHTICITRFLQFMSPSTLSRPLDQEVRDRRLECWGDILNLVAKSFLFDAQRNVSASHPDDYDAAWRAHGPAGKLHIIIQYIRKSPQRRDLFSAMFHRAGHKDTEAVVLDVPSDPKLRPDQQGEWNTIYLMIERALKLQAVFERFCTHSRREAGSSSHVSEGDILNPADWTCLSTMETILRPFVAQSKLFEGRKPASISLVMQSYHTVSSHLCRQQMLVSQQAQSELDFASMSSYDDQCQTNKWLPHLIKSLDLAVAKLDHYGKLLHQTPVYWAALILHPGLRLNYVRFLKRDKNEVDTVQLQFENYYQRWWPPSEAVQQSMMFQEDSDTLDGIPSSFYSAPAAPSGSPVNELNKYFAEPPIKVAQPLQWWELNQHTYPTLSRMAWDLLSIPSQAADAERLFSKAKIMVMDNRHSLNETSMELVQCLSDWS